MRQLRAELGGRLIAWLVFRGLRNPPGRNNKKMGLRVDTPK
jgi:hypothetical protein